MYLKRGNAVKQFKVKRYYLTKFVIKILFVSIYLKRHNAVKRFKVKRYYLPKFVINNYKIIISGRLFYYQPTESDIKQYEGIRKLKVGQGEDYTTKCLLDYECNKNDYRLIAVDLSRQKELDADLKAISNRMFWIMKKYR